MRNKGYITEKLNYFLLYFMVYSCIGWCIETIYMSVSKGIFIKRGFLLGPFCPIYGFGALLLLVFLKSYKHNFILFFFVAIILTSALEYFTGVFIEMIFHQNTWWDYYNEPFNLSGKICLKTSIYWGIFSVIMIYFVHPVIAYFVRSIPINYKTVVINIFTVYFVTDFILVTFSLNGYYFNLRWLGNATTKVISHVVHWKTVIAKSFSFP